MEDENDESWLYGNSEQKAGEQDEDASNDQKPQEGDGSGQEGTADAQTEPTKENGDAPHELDPEDSKMQEAFNETPEDAPDSAEKTQADGEDNDLEDDSDDDDINVVIGDIKSGPSYNIKQRGQAVSGATNAAGKQPTGKFNIEEFEQVGTISGVPAHEFSIDSLEEKPWRKPGADITDYFNYGFNEDTWRAYCERQKRFRMQESGVGLSTLSVMHSNQPIPQNGMGPPMKRPFYPGRKGIDVIGGGGPPQIQHHMMGPPMRPGPPTKENVIQVMTADRREYSRMNRSFGMEDGMGEPFYEEPFDYMNAYEPTQDSQWQGNPGWGPGAVKELTPANPMNIPPPGMGGPHMGGPPMGPFPPGPMGMPPSGPPPMMNMPPHMNVPSQQHSPRGSFDKDRARVERERGADRRRSGVRSRSRSRERSRRPRSRSRERSRRPKSRSRERSHRPRSRSRETSRRRSKSRSRDHERRSKSRDRKKDKERDKDKDKEKDKDRDKDKDKDKDKEKDKSEKEHKKDKKKSHKKDKEDKS